MDASKLKEVLGKLSILKDYSSLVIPIIIALVALLLFIPAKLLSGKLEENIKKESISQTGRRIESLINDAVPQDQWKVEQSYQSEYAEDVNKVLAIAQQSGQRELLSYIVFPEPAYQSKGVITEFAENFRSGVENMVAQARGGDAPADAEISMLIEKFSKDESGKRGNSKKEIDSQIQEAYCMERAKTLRFYASPEIFSGYVAWDVYEFNGMQNGVRDCWYWQLGYWVIEDMLKTVKAVNGDAPNVTLAPIKRVQWLGFTRASFGGANKDMSFDDSAPRYLLTPDDALTATLTGRISNQEYDILHFQAVVLIDSREVNRFLKELCEAKKHKFYGWDGKGEEKTFEHNAISLLDYTMSTIDTKDEEHKNYRYGDAPVVRLDLICEYLFYKEGYDEIMPSMVKEVLNPNSSENQ